MLLSIGIVRSTTRLNLSWTGCCASATVAVASAHDIKPSKDAFMGRLPGARNGAPLTAPPDTRRAFDGFHSRRDGGPCPGPPACKVEDGASRSVLAGVGLGQRRMRQIRMRASEIGRLRILAGLDDAAADRARAGEVLEQSFSVAIA